MFGVNYELSRSVLQTMCCKLCPHWLVVTILTPSSKSSCKPIIGFMVVQSEPVTVSLGELV